MLGNASYLSADITVYTTQDYRNGSLAKKRIPNIPSFFLNVGWGISILYPHDIEKQVIYMIYPIQSDIARHHPQR